MAAELRERVAKPHIDHYLSPDTHGLKKPKASSNEIKSEKRREPRQEHPAGDEKYGRVVAILRRLAFVSYFAICVCTILMTQVIGAPLYWYNRDWYYSWMSMTKAHFGITITTMTKWWGPTIIRISGDDSMDGQIRQKPDGTVEFAFPERLVMIANHQLYTDWLYLWWVAYANSPQMHGWIYIILKESLKYIPVIGTGMMFYGFIFMSRKMAVDKPRLAHRLQKLKTSSADPSASAGRSLNPMWLLLFPEGTNASANGQIKSGKWAEKIGVKNPQHMLLPRSTGMHFILSELKGTVEYLYDCTVAYEGIPRGDFGEQYFTLSSTYFEGRPPKSVNFHWRRFRVADIPLDTPEAFDEWMRERWYEKDDLMDKYLTNGRFPSSKVAIVGAKSSDDAYIETEVRPRWPGEVMQLFSVVGLVMIVSTFVLRALSRIF
ncbi:1-acyl-sn-glycerol-3-phosphate acyltransferase 2 [Pyricularia oryzae]|nr:1-acyl-sn-glycerol-3-phosphate acyltransferase 2 [Pyricularia oryzae]KAI7917326.1 1-acyl-sn-glycerol-3-phosphate acyltransferase 2 [Pyricularia oryzae]